MGTCIPDTIVDVCQRLKISGFLATNVVFEPQTSTTDKRFAAQVDHILVTDAFVLIIENKRWKGLVIADALPHTVHPSFSHLINESGLEDHFAIQIAPDFGSKTMLTVRTHTGEAAPCTQVRRQAQRLSAVLESDLGVKPWIDTCVFFSHEESHYQGPLKCTTPKGVTTEIAVGGEGLRAAIQGLREAQKARQSRMQITKLGALCSALGADIIGFGDYAERWGKSLISAWESARQLS